MIADAVAANKAWIGAGVFAALFVLERVASATPSTANARRLLRNGVLWAMLLVLSPAVVLPLTAFASAHPLWTRSDDWPAPAAVMIDLLILDLWAYALHRAYHEVPLLWRLHRVHHLDQRLDTTTAVRFHPGEVALSATLRMAPIVALAIPFAHVVAYETALLTASLFHHSNVRLPERAEKALARLIVTPSIHWVHHHAAPADTNSNYAPILSLWDRLFRTQSASTRTPEMEMGLGVADQSIGGLLLAPFEPMARR